MLSKHAIEVIIPFENTHAFGKVLLSDDHETKHQSPLVPKDDMRQYIFQPLFPESQILCDLIAQKSQILCERFVHGCVFLLPSVLPLIQ